MAFEGSDFFLLLEGVPANIRVSALTALNVSSSRSISSILPTFSA